jgi:Tol biopolymer transport system component
MGMKAFRAIAACATLAAAWAGPGAAAEDVARRWTPPELASDQYESSPTFTPDGREIFFMQADTRFQGYRLLWSRCEGGRWTPPVPPPFAAAPPVLEADPFITPDGKRLYYVSSLHGSRNGRGHDDLDIWFVERGPDGGWRQPERLPEPVNSTASELLPRLTADGRLVFGSSRAGGLGRSDIYVATPDGAGGWRVENLGAPVSSAAEEYEAEISRDGRTLIVVADRGDRSHLYRFALVDGRWVEQGRIPASSQVFQVGPLLSPKGDRLLFAQADGERSGEIFEIDLAPQSAQDWPPRCGGG